MKLNRFLAAIIAASSFFVTSCSSDDDHAPLQPQGQFAQGIFVLNEGNFGAANASLSFIGTNNVVINNAYNIVTGEHLGDTAQSIYANDDLLYIVVNGSNTLVVADRYTLELKTTITTGLNNPRYALVSNDKLFVSNWGDPTNPADDYVAVYNATTLAFVANIPVAEGPEKMIEEAGKIYVAQKGGWNYGNKITIINTANNNVLGTIDVADVPDSLVESNGKLFVLSSGKAAWTGSETQGALQTIDLNNNSILNTYTFAVGDHPNNLVTENGKLYFTLNDKVFSAQANSTLPPTQLFSMSAQGVFGAYGFAVNKGKFYVADAGDYISNGDVHVYSNTGDFIQSFAVGSLPNGFEFND